MKKIFFAVPVLLLAQSCSKTDVSGGTYLQPLPATYDFENVNYSGQQARVAMLEEMAAYMKTGNTTGTVVDAAVLKNMFSNTGSPFAAADLNTSGKQLKNKCFSLDQAMFEQYMDSVGMASQSATAGSDGVAGVVTSPSDPTKKYLCGANGVEYMQVVEKGLMGAVFYYQACETYLSEAGIGMSVDNSTVVPGEGTAMEHHWDEAFGYFTAPVDFPQNTTGLKYWAKYSNTVDAHVNTNKVMMDEFKRGRMAISDNNHSVKDNSAQKIKATWDKIIAATAIHYFNEALSNLSNDAVRNHSLSEAMAFVICLKYNTHRKVTLAQINDVLGFMGHNFYQVTAARLNQAKDLLSTVYGLNAVKDLL